MDNDIREALKEILLWSADGTQYLKTQEFLDLIDDDKSESAEYARNIVYDFRKLIRLTNAVGVTK